MQSSVSTTIECNIYYEGPLAIGLERLKHPIAIEHGSGRAKSLFIEVK